MKILYVSEFFYPRLAGAEVWSWELCTALAKKHQVTVITTRIDGTPKEQRIKGVKILRPVKAGAGRVTRKIGAMGLARYVDNYLKNNKPDVIHVNAFTMNVPVSKAAKRLGIPCITAVHSYFGNDWKKITMLGPLLKRMERSTIKGDKSAIMHVPSEYLRKRIKKEVGKDTVVISNWLPDKLPTPKPLPKKTFLFIGSLEAVKNPLPCIMAAKRHNAKLIVVGKGALQQKMQDLALKEKVGCTFIDELTHEETLAYIAGATLVLVPSVTESFSLVALEAVAQGTPVSGNPVGVLPELPGVIAFPPKTIPKRLTAAQQKQIREKYSSKRVVPEIEKLYRKVMR